MSNASSFDRSARKPRIWLWLAATAVLGLLLLIVALATWQTQKGAQVRSALAEIARSGEPATAAELELFYAPPAPDQDSSQLWLDGSALLDVPAFQQAANDLPIVGTEAKIPPPGEPWSDLEAADALLKQYESALAKLHEAADRGGAARYPTQFNQGFNMLLTHAQRLRGAARLLALEAHVRAHRGDASGTAQSIEAMLALGRSLENEPVIVSMLVRLACEGMARHHLTDLLPHVAFADQDLVRLQNRLAQIKHEPALRRALLGERVLGYQELEKLGFGSMPWNSGSADVQTVYLDSMQRLLTASQRPWPAALADARQVEAELEQNAQAASSFGRGKYVMTAGVAASAVAAFSAVGRSRARNDATITALAIERYRRQHGSLPAGLPDLVPDFLPALPIDPFNGRPLRYQPSQAEYVIYNVGADGIDNRGQGDDTGKPDDVLRIKLPSMSR